MKDGPDFTRIANLMGDPARANILTTLMSGRALTAAELAAEAGVSPQTASSHLSKLQGGGLLRQRKQGRHRYFALADDAVARTIEALMGLAADRGHLRTRTGPRDVELRRARVCYNHLAGGMGVHMFAALTKAGHLEIGPDGLALTPSGTQFVERLGIPLDDLARSRAAMCRECLDWSARRSHLAGKLGRAFLARFETLGWARRVEGTRIVRFSPAGTRHFADLFGPLPAE